MVSSSLSLRLLQGLVGISAVVLLASLSANAQGFSSSAFFQEK
jgi:hypothetical protein